MTNPPVRLWRRRWFRVVLVLLVWLVSLAAAFRVGAFAYKYRANLRAFLRSRQPSQIVATNLYNVRLEALSIPAEGRDGGIAALGDGVLFVNRQGRSWFADRDRSIRPLSLQVPINVAEFEADPYNANTILRDRFAVKDILVQPVADGVRILASHNHWHADRDCYALRVSSIHTRLESLLEGSGDGDWSTVFETSPCRPLTDAPDGKRRNPTLGAGGRLALLPDGTLLVTVGQFGPEALTSDPEPDDPNSSYGKTILVDLATGQSRIFTRGHRNPQGLTVAADGRIWLTEHAARGGDELNRLLDGRDYGYPNVSYGTEYESMVWRHNPVQGRHEGYEKPRYAWIPSIGISQLVSVERDAFPYWKGDLLVSSLASESLYRVRIEEERTVLVEPLSIGHRVRDIIETAAGGIVLKTDDNFLVFLDPVSATGAGSTTLSPAERGQVLSAQCQGCHTFTRDGAEGIGPNLWRIVGRDIAGGRDFEYSEALRTMAGDWTEESLRRFLADPGRFAPGTTMQSTATYTEQQLSDLIAYLGTLR
jgi:cytochrome c2